MDHKTILIIALFVLCVLLFAGLPDEGFDAAAASPQTGSSGQAHSAWRSDPTKELAELREERARLYRQLDLLRAKLENQTVMARNAQVQGGSCSSQDDEEPSGMTVYLETSPAGSSDREVRWTAVNFRDAGISPDGSKRAVLRITRTANHGHEQVAGDRNGREDWQ